MRTFNFNIQKTLLAFALLVFTFQTTFAEKKKKTEKAVIKTAISCDHCKQCETCGKKFEAEIYNTKGIKQYEIDAKANTITVYYNPGRTNLQEIKTAISNLGYDADDIKANPLAYDKLDDCCKR